MRYITIISILVLIFVLFCVIDKNTNSLKEHLEISQISTEAIQNLASMYNNEKIVTNNLDVTKDAKITGNVKITGETSVNNDANVSGNVRVGGNLAVVGNVTANNLKTDAMVPSGDKLIIGSSDKPLILNQKYYVGRGLHTSGGDIKNESYREINDVIKACRSDPRCDRIRKGTAGTGYWLKFSNDPNWLIGSTEWGPDIYFSGNYSDYDNSGGDNLGTGPATSFDDCYQRAVTGGKTYFNYTSLTNKNDSSNCRGIPIGGAGGETIFIKKY